MAEHDTIRGLLVLVALGALDASEQQRVESHLAVCATCAAELEGWQELARGWKRLPKLQAPAGLVERTRMRIQAQFAAEAERRWNRGVTVFLLLFAWTVTLASWPIVRLINEGITSWLDLRSTNLWLGLAAYTAFGWLVAGVAAVTLGVRHRQRRAI